jgi:hypothetical protein
MVLRDAAQFRHAAEIDQAPRPHQVFLHKVEKVDTASLEDNSLIRKLLVEA